MLPNNPNVIKLPILLFHHHRKIKFDQKRFLRAIRTKSRSNNDEGENYQSDIVDQQTDCNYLGINEKQDFHIASGPNRCYDDRDKHRKQIKEKYQPLLEPNKKHTTAVRTKVGLLNVRFDSENRPSFHGEFEKRDELIYNNLDDVVKHLKQFKVDIADNDSIESNIKSSKFEENDYKVDEKIEPSKKLKSTPPKSILDDKIQFRYADQFVNKDNQTKNTENANEDWITFERSKREPKPKSVETEMSLSEKIASIQLEDLTQTEKKDKSTKPEIISGYEYLKQIRSGKRTAHFHKEFDELRNFIAKEKLDSKGYRILTNQVPDFSKLTNNEVLNMLEKQILFNDEDIVALNKPYGIAIHAAFGCSSSINTNNDDDDVNDNSKMKISTSRINSKFNHVIHLGYFLSSLAERLGCSKLYTVHRLDRDTTGALLLTKTQEKAQKLNELFREQKIEKKYLCITKNVPDKREGIIDIPIELGYIKSSNNRKRERMVLCPEPLEGIRLQRQWRTAKRAITHYRVKSDHGNAALLEVQPETGVRHQIRVHLGFGLRCPILGDHKYSHLDSLSPQKLPTDILMALKIRQAKTRHVPMHLHSYLLMIPQMGKDGRNIFIRAPLPYHFRQNMRSLKLSLDD